MEAAVMNAGDLVVVTIDALGSRGEGSAQLNEMTVFVPKTAVGDTVEVKIEATKGRHAFGRLNRLIEVSSRRRKPRCSHFDECGGCDLQHISYQDQIEWKRRVTEHWISRSPLQKLQGGFSISMIESPHEFEYRHRARFQIQNSKPAFYKARSRNIVELDECPVLEKSTWSYAKQRAIDLQSAKDLAIVTSNTEGISSYSIGEHRFEYDVDCFTQGNLYVNSLLFDRVASHANHYSGKRALDLYAGIGNFTTALLSHFEEVYAVESHPQSVMYGKKNASAAHWILAQSEDAIHQLTETPVENDLVVMDPSRIGALEVCRVLADKAPHAIIYISCQLDSLIKDLCVLTKDSRFRIKDWTVVDLFPQTRHIESLVILERT